jgi:hypothetical protein
MPMPSPRPAAHLPNPPQRGIGHAVAPGGLVHRANPLPVDAIGALEAQINQLHDFAEVLRQQRSSDAWAVLIHSLLNQGDHTHLAICREELCGAPRNRRIA